MNINELHPAMALQKADSDQIAGKYKPHIKYIFSKQSYYSELRNIQEQNTYYSELRNIQNQNTSTMNAARMNKSQYLNITAEGGGVKFVTGT